MDLPFKELNRVAHNNSMDIEFQDLTYSVLDYNEKSGKQVIKSINGRFRSGELTAIMGPSGAGKSTLLNILAGYVTTHVTGTITINGVPRILEEFTKNSAYIMQEDLIQPRLTVEEAMMFAARLKFGSNIDQSEKEAVVMEVISLLDLGKCCNTRSENLSGGQKKRVAVALELVNNPPVIFLDEPTTGLDNVAAKRCMELLHKLTELGRTVICTIHQPPSSLFKNFDQVYVMAEGYCCYNGSPSNLVPFLADLNNACPTTHTPAEYIIEIIHSNLDAIKLLSDATENGKSILRTSQIQYKDVVLTNNHLNHKLLLPVSLWTQMLVLFSRRYLQMRRDYTGLIIQIVNHIFSAVVAGGTVLNIGQDAEQVLTIFKFNVHLHDFFMFTYFMLTVIKFPLDRQIVEREFFNGWYDLKAYYLTTTLISLPLLVIFGIGFIIISYIMAGLPMEWSRFLWFCIILLLCGVISEGVGYCIGTLCNVTIGCIMASVIMVPLLVLGVYGMGYGDTVEPVMKIVTKFSYLRCGIVTLSFVLFRDRQLMNCNKDYCHYMDPEHLIRDLGIQHENFTFMFSMLIVYFVLFRVMAYFLLKFRLQSELFKKLERAVQKISMKC